jgi:hypothetical protein
MSNLTTIGTSNNTKPKSIAIKAYFEATSQNMGLEKYGLPLYDSIVHTEQLACLDNNGIVRYLTGLNEFAPNIKLLPPEEKAAKIKAIRTAVAEFEKEMVANVLEIDDKDFWNKVVLLKPNNADFWNKITISCGNENVYLDPTDPYDRLKLYAIEEGGFSMIAKSYEDARTKVTAPKFYLDKEQDTVIFKTEYKKLKNKALAELQKLYDKNSIKLFYIAKVLDANSPQYKKSTPNDVLYDNMDRHICGDGSESNKERSAKGFLTAAEMDMETLKIKAIIKDSVFFKFIINKVDGHIYHTDTNSLLGRNVSDVLEFLKNPLNEDLLKDLNMQVEKVWNS